MRSGERDWWVVIILGTKQIELHPRNVLPAAVLPSNAAVQANVLEAERLMETVARRVWLGNAGEGPSVATLSEPLQ
jgi:hypothetical protein